MTRDLQHLRRAMNLMTTTGRYPTTDFPDVFSKKHGSVTVSVVKNNETQNSTLGLMKPVTDKV